MYYITADITDLYNDFKFGVAITKIMECIQMVCVLYCGKCYLILAHIVGQCILTAAPAMAVDQTARGTTLVGYSPTHWTRVCAAVLYTTLPHTPLLHDGRQAKDGPGC